MSMIKNVAALSLIAITGMAVAATVPQPPEVAAAAYIIEDAQSGQVLASKGLHDQVEPASLTKLMTA